MVHMSFSYQNLMRLVFNELSHAGQKDEWISSAARRTPRLCGPEGPDCSRTEP